MIPEQRSIRRPAKPTPVHKPPNENLRALGWHLAITAGAVGTLCAIVLFGVIAVLNFGAIIGCITTMVLAIAAIGVTSWLITGKERPQA